MSERIVQQNEEAIKGQLKDMVRVSVEETLNEMLEHEAEKLTQAARYERNEVRQGYRSGHYDRNLNHHFRKAPMYPVKGVSFETVIIEGYRRRESSEEAIIEMYLAGVSVRRIEDINVAIFVAIAVNEDGYHEGLGIAEGLKKNKASWVKFFQRLEGCELDGVKLIVRDKCLEMLEAV